MHGLTLLLPDKADDERDAVADAWERRGGSVLRIARFWDPPPLIASSVRVYGADAFCLVLAEKLALRLVSPDDRLLSTVSDQLLRRRIHTMQLGQLGAECFPVFAKPVVPKQFRSAVYQSLDELRVETLGLAADVEIIVSEVVTFAAEARAFVLDGMVKACAIYEGDADTSHAAAFAQTVAKELAIPRTCVIDVGLLADGVWALVECNATWGAGLNGCDPASVVDCIEAATTL